MGRPLLSLVGQVFTNLTAREFVGRRGHSSHWRCDCVCGAVVEVSRSVLLNGTTKSCGCFNAERVSKLNFKHGGAKRRNGRHRKSPEYKVWDGIKQRCYNQENPNYRLYGGLGVTLHVEWIDDFSAFINFVGLRPSPKHSLDRYPDKNGNYEPGNVRWATATEQGRNKRNNRMVESGGKMVCLSQAAEDSGLPYHVVKSRLSKGWSIERALSEPLDVRKSDVARLASRMAKSVAR